jgi:hypothetical protein
MAQATLSTRSKDRDVASKRTDREGTSQDKPDEPDRPNARRAKQVNVRLSQEILDDIAIIEKAHGLDTSSAIRMILTESRHSIVQRARRILEERGRGA